MSLSVPLAAWSQYTSHGHTTQRLHLSDHGTLAHASESGAEADHGHTHQATETPANFSGHDHGHNPFDHSHETQHPPPDLTIKYLTAVHPWDNGINIRQPLGSVERVERPPRSRLQF